jgi:hypothetical protein
LAQHILLCLEWCGNRKCHFLKETNMSIDRVAAYNNEIYQRTEYKRLEQRHEERRLEERRNKQLAEVSEQKRIEQNRQMNRAGQNVDRMA